MLKYHFVLFLWAQCIVTPLKHTYAKLTHCLSLCHTPPESVTPHLLASWHFVLSLVGIRGKPGVTQRWSVLDDTANIVMINTKGRLAAYNCSDKQPQKNKLTYLDYFDFFVCRSDGFKCFFLLLWLLWQHHCYAALLHSVKKQNKTKQRLLKSHRDWLYFQFSKRKTKKQQHALWFCTLLPSRSEGQPDWLRSCRLSLSLLHRP